MSEIPLYDGKQTYGGADVEIEVDIVENKAKVGLWRKAKLRWGYGENQS